MKIGVFGSEYQVNRQELLLCLFNKLHSMGAEVYVDCKFYEFLKQSYYFEPPIAGLIYDDEFDFDIVLSVGGDGTFLNTAARVGIQNIPVLGINTGRLGFLADVSSVEVETTLDDLFSNDYIVEERTLLSVKTEEGLFEGYNFALNEVAIQKRDTSSLITIHVHLNGEYLTSYEADGLVIATPTGSTAYSMSVNGPIIIPQCNNIVLSPVAPHSLNVRPLVIPDSYIITLNVESRSDHFLVALDGRAEVFPTGIQLEIKKADYTTKIIKRNDYTFYNTLREKLMWGADVRKNNLNI